MYQHKPHPEKDYSAVAAGVRRFRVSDWGQGSGVWCLKEGQTKIKPNPKMERHFTAYTEQSETSTEKAVSS